MSGLGNGSEFNFTLTKDIDPSNPQFRRALTILEGLGAKPGFLVPLTEDAVTLVDMERRSPITTGDGFLGREHFWVYAMAKRVPLKTSTFLLNRLLNPAPRHRPHTDFGAISAVQAYQGLNIVTAPRKASGLSELPEHLQVELQLSCPNANTHAIQASSLVTLAQNHSALIARIDDCGPATERALVTIGNHVAGLIS